MEAQGKRLGAWGFCAFTVPAVLILPALGWLWAALGAMFTAVFLACLLHFRKKETVPLAMGAAQSTPGKVFIMLLLLWNLFALGAAARQLCAIFPTAKETPLLGLLLLLLSAYAARKKAAAQVAAVCFFFLLGLYGIFFGFSLPDLRNAYLMPQTEGSWKSLTAVLAPLSLIYLYQGEKGGKAALWLVLGVIFSLLSALVTVGSLSPSVVAQEKFPFYEAAKNVTLFHSIQHLEPLVSAGLCAGGFCLLSLYCAVNTELLRGIFPAAEKFSGLINFSLGSVCLWLSRLCSGELIAIGTTIFWGIIPLILLLLGKGKKSQKF